MATCGIAVIMMLTSYLRLLIVRILKITVIGVFLLLTLSSVCSAQVSDPGRADFPTLQSNVLNGSTPSQVVIADFNNDSFADIAVLNAASVDVLLNDNAGTGTYGNVNTLTFPANLIPIGLAAADIDGGAMDLVVSLQDTALVPLDQVGVYSYSGNGDGTFREVALLSGSGVANPVGIVAADFTGDGIADIAVANTATRNGSIVDVTLFTTTRNNGGGDGGGGASAVTFTGSRIANINGDNGILHLADMNNDTIPDLITANEVFIGNGNGSFSAQAELDGGGDFAIGRLDGDNFPDIAQLNSSQGASSDIIVQTTGTNGSLNASQTIPSNNARYTDIAIADLNLDGLGDIIATDSDDNSVKIFLQYCDGTFPETPIRLGSGNARSALASAFLNNDTLPDIVALYHNNGGNNALASVWIQAIPVVQGGSIQFCNNELSELESAGIVDVEINRVNGSQGAVAINYTAEAFGMLAPAELGVDFNDLTGGSVMFQDGDVTPKYIQFEIIDDLLKESDETFQIVMTLATGSVVLDPTNDWANVSIVNNDANQLPIVVTGGNQTVGSGTSVTLDGSGSSDPDGMALTSFVWEQLTPGANSVILTTGLDPAVASFTAPTVTATTILSFQLTITDNFGGSSAATMTVTIEPGGTIPNTPPISLPGSNQLVDEQTSVTLDGSASSDVEGPITTYLWVQAAPLDVPVVLSGVDTAIALFTAPTVSASQSPLLLNFDLTVTDAGGLSHTASVQVSVKSVNIAPVADAGPAQSVSEGVLVNLDGSSSSGVISSYTWTQTAGPSVTLSDTAISNPTFTSPTVTASTALTFLLTVTDNGGLTDTASVTVTINPLDSTNQPPVANAGLDSTVTQGSTVRLDGTGSTDSDGTVVGYSWTQTAGEPVVTLGAVANGVAEFVAPTVVANTVLTFQLLVTDDLNATATATVKITIAINTAPIANAGDDQSVAASAEVNLTAVASTDSDGSIVAYLWEQTSGSNVVLIGSDTETVSFTAPTLLQTETLQFSLTVTDNKGATATDSVSITVTVLLKNDPPIVDAGTDSNAVSDTVVELNGQGTTDPENDTLSYNWRQVSGPSVTVKNPSAIIASFIAPIVEASTRLIFSLTVADGSNDAVVAMVEVTVLPQGVIANAGDVKIVASGSTVSLEAAASTGSNDTGLVFQWSQISGTEVTLSDMAIKTLTFDAPILDIAELLQFQLSVTDSNAELKTDIVDVQVLGQNELTFVVRPTINVNGNAGSVLVSVDRVGDLTAVSSVEYSTKDVTAYSGLDYDGRAGVFEFLAGENSKTIEIPIIDVEALDDLDKFFRFELTMPEGVFQHNQTVTRIVIHDHEVHPDPNKPIANASAAEKTKFGSFDPMLLCFFIMLVLVRQFRRTQSIVDMGL